MKQVFVISLILYLFAANPVHASSQISPRDGLWLSLPPDSVKCIVLRLPQDAGLSGEGNYIFSVTCEPSPDRSWADLSGQLVREVHQNNTVLIPICFDTAGNKPIGNCSEPYTITLSESFTGTTMKWRGGICVSEYPDADIVDAEASSSDDVRDILNDHTDIVSAWFAKDIVYAMPGDDVEFNLSVQSYAELDIDASINASVGISPTKASLRTGPQTPLGYIIFNATSPSEEGEYPITATIRPRDCMETYCTKTVSGRLVVSRSPLQETAGFTVTLNPESIDTKEPRDVIMTLSIINNMKEARQFSTSVFIEPNDSATGFRGEVVEIGPFDSHSRVFSVVPGTSSRLYTVTALVRSGETERSATSFITIDEMVADALREAHGLDDSARAEVDSFITRHASSSYGSDLQQYKSLKEALADAKKRNPAPRQNSSTEAQVPASKEEPWRFSWMLVPVLIVSAAVIALILVKSRHRRKEDVEYY